jgi:uncharacterized membrane protein HdeD (DUF308 family)
MTSEAAGSTPLQAAVREEVRELKAIWWWFLILGIFWTLFGMFVLSYRVGSVYAVAAFVGWAFILSGFTQFAVASRVEDWSWVFVLLGILSVVAGIVTLAWPDNTLYIVSIFLAWYLIVFGIVHVVDALAGPKVAWWWTELLLGIAELVLGVWAARSFERSLLTLVTLVGVWAIFHGVNEIFAAFTLREGGKQVEQLVR